MKYISRLSLIITAFSALLLSAVLAQDHMIEVWPNGAPGAIQNPEYTEGLASDKPHRILRVSKPTLAVYLPDPVKNTGSAVLILPGGGYRRLAMDHEGYAVAEWLNSIGVAAFLLKYRLPNDSIMVDKKIGPLQDAQESIRLIRRYAGKWQVHKDKVGVIGFSAGGHLAATLSTRFDEMTYASADTIPAQPDFAILVYPVISMLRDITHTGSRRRLLGNNPADSLVNLYSNELQINEHTPATFIVHAADDQSVMPENSIRYFQALQAKGVSAELHIYQQGGHGFGLNIDDSGESTWTKNCQTWLQNLGML
jgi:acetyl esterase/lipase